MAPVDREKLRSHLDHLRGDLRRLERIRDEGRSALLENEVTQAAATRWLQTAVEAMIDIANHVIAKGVHKRIKELYPQINLLFLDADAGVSEVNFFNRMHFFVNHAKEAHAGQGVGD